MFIVSPCEIITYISFDGNGRQTKTTDSREIHSRYYYDNLGRQTRVSSLYSATESAFSETQYDADRLTRHTGPNSYYSAYYYDNQEIVSWVFSNHVVDTEVNKDFFKFTPPENIKIIDMTPMIKSMLETMSKPVQETEAEKTKTEPQTAKTEDIKKTVTPSEKSDKTTEEQKQLPEKITETTPEE